MDTESSTESGFLTRLKDAYLNLRRKNPNHELLSLATLVSDERVFDFSEKYYERFVDARDEFGTFGYDRYTKTLEEAVTHN